MFFGMMLVDAALAAWAVGVMQQPGAPRWVRYVLVGLGLTLVASVGLVLLALDSTDTAAEKNASLIGPVGAGVALIALSLATALQRRAARLRPPGRPTSAS